MTSALPSLKPLHWRHEIQPDSPIKIFRGSNATILLRLANKKVRGYVLDPQTELLTPLHPYDLPKELHQITTPELFEAFLDSVHGRVSLLSNGDVKLYLHPRGVGGGKLHEAVAQGDLEAVQSLLSGGCNVDVTDNNAWTALHIAASKGNEKLALMLLSKGANITYTNKEGNTALHIAALAGKMNMCRALLEHGASVRALNAKSETASDLALSERHTAVAQLLSRDLEKELATWKVQQKKQDLELEQAAEEHNARYLQFLKELADYHSFGKPQRLPQAPSEAPALRALTFPPDTADEAFRQQLKGHLI